MSLLLCATSFAHQQDLALAVIERYMNRQLLDFCKTLGKRVREGTEHSTTCADWARDEITKIAEGSHVHITDPIGKSCTKIIGELSAGKTDIGGIIGVPSGFHALDRITNGWHPKTLTIPRGQTIYR